MKKIAVIVLTLIFLLIPMMVNAGFSDVPDDHWAKEYIDDLTSKGVINGYTDGTYGPSDTLTNGQFLKLILTASIENADYSVIESDNDHWAWKYLIVANNYNILENAKIVINEENIDQPISRINVVKILGLCDIEMRNSKQNSTDNLDFYDIYDLESIDHILLAHAVGSGVINGYSDGSFKPNNNLTRAEAAKIMYVYMNNKQEV